MTVFEAELICAADSVSSDYGDANVMLMAMNKFRPTYDNARLVKDHLLNPPTILRVMHGGLQAGHGQSEYKK